MLRAVFNQTRLFVSMLFAVSVSANLAGSPQASYGRLFPKITPRKPRIPKPAGFDDWMGNPEMADLRHRSRKIALFTTASLPWLTGTSINPLLRAVFLENAPQQHDVTLCIPFIPLDQQQKLHPEHVFETPKHQEEFVRNWVCEKLGCKTKIKIAFYDAKFIDSIGSIIAAGDMTTCVPENERDVAVLEEPEHLNWFHTGTKWCDAFNYVVGVIHTKYLFYRSQDAHISPALRPAWTYGWEVLNAWVARAYCHHIIKLSDAVQDFSDAVTCNVHGVRDSYRKIGLDMAKRAPSARFRKGAYYIGKVLWSKGYRELVDKMKAFRDATGINLPVDCYGSGPDLDDIKAEVERLGLEFHFKGAIDHADAALHEYKILINPSLSDVVCTTSAEALAMGKFLLCPAHPSNAFFTQFANTLPYDSSDDASFVQQLSALVASNPAPMTPESSSKLSWTSATERFYDAAAACARTEQPTCDKWLAKAHGVAASALRRSFAIDAAPSPSPSPLSPSPDTGTDAALLGKAEAHAPVLSLKGVDRKVQALAESLSAASSTLSQAPRLPPQLAGAA